MYHNNRLNQVSIKEKSLSTKSFSRKDSQTDHYTFAEQRIYRYLFPFQKYSLIKISNATIAKAIGCSERTVRRATAKFHKDGLIIKHQENKYTSNSYIFIQSEYVRPNLRSSLNINLFINLSPSSRRREADIRVFKKTNYPEKGDRMKSYQDRLSSVVKLKPKRNDGGHSPAVFKPILPLEDQIMQLNNDIKSLSDKIELNKVPSYMISYAMNLVEHKIKELRELKAQHENTAIYN